jgi:hypothetical protein
MNSKPTIYLGNVPTLDELTSDLGVSYKNDQLNLLLNQEPPKAWVKEHPMAKGVTYLPIDKVEHLLTKIFQEWKVEVISYSQLFNSVTCHVRLHYKRLTDGQWSYHDGVGAVGIQKDKGSNELNLSTIKQDAVMKALPAAKSYAIKDAADHLGKLFGRDLGRKETLPFKTSFEASDELLNELKELFELKKDVLNKEDVEAIDGILSRHESYRYKSVIKNLKSK